MVDILKNKLFLFLCTVAFVPWKTFAQENSHKHDVGLWVNADVAPKTLAGKWQPLFSLEYRSRDNLRKVDLFCGTILMDYIINKYLDVGAGYEIFANKLSSGGFGLEHRFYPEVILRVPFANFTASMRARLLNTFERISDPNWATRIRFKLGYKITTIPLTPYMSVEPYHRIADPSHYSFSKIRYIGGCAYSISHQQFDVYYLAEDYHDKPFTRHVVGIGYCYSF